MPGENEPENTQAGGVCRRPAQSVSQEQLPQMRRHLGSFAVEPEVPLPAAGVENIQNGDRLVHGDKVGPGLSLAQRLHDGRGFVLEAIGPERLLERGEDLIVKIIRRDMPRLDEGFLVQLDPALRALNVQ